MSLTLRTCETDKFGAIVATYKLTHDTAETHLELALDVVVSPRAEACRAKMTIETPDLGTPDVALDKLADWLERSAAAIRARKPSVSLPTGVEIRPMPVAKPSK